MTVSEIELFEILSQQLGREKAKTLVEYVEHKVDKRLQDKTNVFATKEDLAKLETRIVMWIVGFNTVLASLIIAAFKLL